MAAVTHLLEFNMEPAFLHDQELKNKILQKVTDLFKDVGLDHQSNNHDLGPKHGLLLFFSGTSGRNATVQIFADGSVTVNIQIPSSEAMLKEFDLHSLVKDMKILMCSKTAKVFPEVKRCARLERYFPNTANMWVEYDFDRIVFEENTPYQNVKIMHSTQYGNVLILDNDINLAESDLVYTLAITGNGREDYQDKEILILGGGDGGILNELLQKSPAHITMVESNIDQVVINASRKYLSGICHDSLNKLEGPNYKVLIGDCIPVLESYAKEGHTFDYVINDLTAIPITLEPRGSQWDFTRYILDLSMKVLKPSGKYFTQGNGVLMKTALSMYEDLLQKLSCRVSYRKEVVCVPSYMEMWVFYEIWKIR